MSNRPSWYYGDHPPACTCVQCGIKRRWRRNPSTYSNPSSQPTTNPTQYQSHSPKVESGKGKTPIFVAILVFGLLASSAYYIYENYPTNTTAEFSSSIDAAKPTASAVPISGKEKIELYISDVVNHPPPNTTELIPSRVLELVQEYIDFECHIASPLRLHPVAQLPFIASYEIDDLWHVYDRGQLGGTAGMADGHPQKRPLTFFTVHDKTQVVDTTYEGERSPSTQMCIPNFRN